MKPPTELRQLQKWLASVIRLPLRERGERGLPLYQGSVLQEIEQNISPGLHLTAAETVGIYNQQYWYRFFTLLQEQFPTLTRLFGFSGFNREIAEPYLLAHPVNHWSLIRIGEHLAEWILAHYAGEDRLFLYEVALVDYAYEQSAFAPWTPQPPVLRLTLHADLFAFRKALLEHPPVYWLTADFPPIEWGELRFYTGS